MALFTCCACARMLDKGPGPERAALRQVRKVLPAGAEVPLSKEPEDFDAVFRGER